uniref:HSF-type DNA-binding domain-containing protein n=1 Tax=Odontella aurita TaxID=265563 RepID=A0A7S4HXU0_9STRA
MSYTSAPTLSLRRSGGISEKDTFPQKLHRALDALEDDGLDSILSWLPHGRAIKVHRPSAFASDAVRPYFGMVKASSFTRQLNIWGFKRVCSGVDKGAYYHSNFLRSRPGLLGGIKREATKGTGAGRKKETPGIDPDFYSMPPPERKKALRDLPAPISPPYRATMERPYVTSAAATVVVDSQERKCVSPPAQETPILPGIQHVALYHSCEQHPALSASSDRNLRSISPESFANGHEGRYDESLPVSADLMEWLEKSRIFA